MKSSSRRAILGLVILAMGGLAACGPQAAPETPAQGKTQGTGAPPAALVGVERMARVGRLAAARGAGPGFRLESLSEGTAALGRAELSDEHGQAYVFEALAESEAGRKGYDFVLRGAGPDGRPGTLDDLRWHPEPRPLSPSMKNRLEPEPEPVEED